MIPGVPSTSGIAALAVTALAVAVTAAATTTGAPTTTSTPTTVAPTTTTPPVPSPFVAPDGTFAITLPGVPAASAEVDTGSDAFTLGVGEDLVAVTRYPLDAFDGDPAATTSARVDGLLDASGTVLDELARVDTTLWSYPATYFIDELALDTGPTVTLYGLVTTTADRATYVVYTDLGGNDADTARAAVQSYTVLVPSCPVPAPPPPPTTTTVATAAAAATTSTSAPASTPSTTSTATAVATTAAPTSTVVVPADVVITAVDGRWQAAFPAGSRTTCSASARDGFTVSTYAGALGDDRLAVRVTNVPAAFEWTPDDAVGASGADVGDVQRTTVDGRDAVRFSYPTDDGGTVDALAVRDGDQLVELDLRRRRRLPFRGHGGVSRQLPVRLVAAIARLRDLAQIAQSVEHFTRNEKVQGSIPCLGSTNVLVDPADSTTTRTPMFERPHSGGPSVDPGTARTRHPQRSRVDAAVGWTELAGSANALPACDSSRATLSGPD